MRTSKTALIAMAMSVVMTNPVYAEEQKPNTVVFQEDMKLWSNPSIPEATRKFMELVYDSSSDERAARQLAFTRDELQRSIGTTDLVQLGSEVKKVLFHTRETYLGNTSLSKRTIRMKSNSEQTMFYVGMDAELFDAYMYAGDYYPADLERVAKLVREEVGIVAGEDYVTALTKINDWIMTNIRYDENTAYYRLSETLTQRAAVCRQYTILFEMMADYCGIPCDSIITKDQNHVVSRVTLDNKQYYVDVSSNACQGQRLYFLTESYDLFGGVV